MKKLVGLVIIATIITAVFTAMVGMSMNTSSIEKDIVGDFAMSHEYSKAISNEKCCSPMWSPIASGRSCCAIDHWGLINVEKGEIQQIFTDLYGYQSVNWVTIYCTEGRISITAPYLVTPAETYYITRNIRAGQSITIHQTKPWGVPWISVNVTGTGKGYYRISHCCLEGITPYE